MSDGPPQSSLGGIRFVSKESLDAKKEAVKAAKAAKEAREAEERKARRAEAKAKAASGEAQWVAPAIERRLDGDKKSHKKEKKHKKEKHKKSKHRHADAAAAGSSSGGESDGGGGGGGRATTRHCRRVPGQSAAANRRTQLSHRFS